MTLTPADEMAADPSTLDAIETASRDEIAALQLTRMQWSLRHAYDNVAHYKQAFDKKGVHPDDLKDVVYTMRFDEASAVYAEFGPFYTGLVGSADEVLTTIGIN